MGLGLAFSWPVLLFRAQRERDGVPTPELARLSPVYIRCPGIPFGGFPLCSQKCFSLDDALRGCFKHMFCSLMDWF